MSDTFDPYRQWLDIADLRRPLDHYALLGLESINADREQIWERALARMDRVLQADPGLRSAEGRKVYEEIEAARDCLCHTQRKQDYDRRLRELQPAERLVPAPLLAEASAPPAIDPSSSEPAPKDAAETPAPAESVLNLPSEANGTPLDPQAAAIDAIEPEQFDPYQQWLGISNPQRPLNHYELLGLRQFEDDRERIDEISMLLMAEILQYDPGPQCEHARRVFDELNTARDCLCDGQKKREYDALLRGERVGKPLSSASSKSAIVQKKSWSSLAAHASVDVHADHHFQSGLATAEASDSGIRRRSETPQPAQSIAATEPWDQRLSRILGIASGLVIASLLIGYLLVREPSEQNPVPYLLNQLNQSDPYERIAAAKKLSKLGPRASDALPDLVRRLASDEDEHVRLAIAQAVRNAGPGAVAYTRDFEIIRLQEKNPGVQQILDELLNQ